MFNILSLPHRQWHKVHLSNWLRVCAWVIIFCVCLSLWACICLYVEDSLGMDSWWLCEYAWLPAYMINSLSKCQRMGLECKSNCTPTAHTATVYLFTFTLAQNWFICISEILQRPKTKTIQLLTLKHRWSCLLLHSMLGCVSVGFLVKLHKYDFEYFWLFAVFRVSGPCKWLFRAKQKNKQAGEGGLQIDTKASDLKMAVWVIAQAAQPSTAGGLKVLLSSSWVSVFIATWMCRRVRVSTLSRSSSSKWQIKSS